MSDESSVDANVLLYAPDSQDLPEQQIARRRAATPSTEWCTRVYAEALHHGRTILGVEISNPFA